MVRKRWSKKASESLRAIFEFYEGDLGRKVVHEILKKIDQLQYTEQYQLDEIVGPPYRRIILRNYRIVYKVVTSEEIEILQIFDNRQSPERTRTDFRK